MSKEVNTRITVTLSESHFKYVEDYAKKTNMPKSSILQLAVETLASRDEQLDTYKRMVAIAEKEQLEAFKGEIYV